MRSNTAILSLVVACALSAGEAAAQVAVGQLELGEPNEAELAAGAIHSYSFDLEAGQFALVMVDQRGIDVSLAVFDPDGDKVSEFDSPNGARGPEPASIVAERTGSYRIEVRPLGQRVEPGHYVIELVRREAAATTPSGQVDQLLAAWDRPDSPGLAVAVVKDGTIVYKRGLGSADLEHGIPITPSTVFDIASVSKQFTGLAIAMLVVDGKLSLDDDMRDHLPEMPDFGKRITIRHLLHHTSGLRDWTSVFPIVGRRFEDVISFEDILRMARNQRELNYDPGEEYSYTNTGYNLLAAIVERATGQPFAAWTEENIFRPLGMMTSHFQSDHDQIVRDRARSYAPDPEKVYRNVANNLTALGSSSLYTTVEDLAAWVLNFESARVGGPEAIQLTHQQGVLNNGREIGYAFGQGVGDYRGLRTISHGGSWAGFRTHIIRFPDRRLAVIVLGNSSTVNAGGTAQQVADIYLADVLGQPPRPATSPDRAGVVVERAVLLDYVGTYRLGPGWLLTVTSGDGRLMAEATAEAKFPMTALSDTTFWVDDYGAGVRFVRDSTGRVSHLEYRGIEAARVEPYVPGPDELTEYSGTYYSEELDTRYALVVEDGRLVARHWENGDIPLYATQKDEFRGGVWWLRLVEFTRDADDQVVGLDVTNGRVRNLRFVRR